MTRLEAPECWVTVECFNSVYSGQQFDYTWVVYLIMVGQYMCQPLC